MLHLVQGISLNFPLFQNVHVNQIIEIHNAFLD